MGKTNWGRVLIGVVVVLAVSLVVVWFMNEQDRVADTPPEVVPPSSAYTPPPEQLTPPAEAVPPAVDQ